MRLFLVRHGQTTANVERIFAGQADVMLTEQGRQEALAIRPVLADFTFDKVYTSDLTRAIETQKLALPGAVSTPTPLIRELDEGTLTSTSIQEAKDRGMCIDATYGRRTRAVIITDSDHVLLSAVQPETVANRLDSKDVDDDE